MHGHGVNRDHSTVTCIRQRDVHVKSATRSNPSGPGEDTNHGWDVGILRCGSVVDNTLDLGLSTSNYFSPILPTATPESAIADSGSSNIYLTLGAPSTHINIHAPKFHVGASTVQDQTSSASCQLHLDLPVRDAHIMPGFKHSLLGIGKLCDKNCTVLFAKQTVQVFSPQSEIILPGWHNQSFPLLWRFSMLPTVINIPPTPPNAQSAIATVFSAYDVPIVEALVLFYHADVGFPSNSTWLQTINAGNFSTWPGLATTNATKYCPHSVETSKYHMTQMCQGLCSTKPKRGNQPVLAPAPNPYIAEPLPPVSSNKVHVEVAHIIKLYTGDMGRLPVISCSRNQYSMLSYHCDSNSVNI